MSAAWQRVCWLAAALLLLLVSSGAGEEPAETDPAVRKHRAALKDDYWPDQYRAIQALGGHGVAATCAVPELLAVLKSKEANIRAVAAEALGKIDPAAKGVVPALIAALKDRDELVRAAAAQALGRAGPAGKDAVPALAIALQDSASEVRMRAVLALGHIGPAAQAAAPALRRLAQTAEWSLRESARESLVKITTATAEAPAVLALKTTGPAAFSPDGRRLVCGGEDIAVWDAFSGQRLFALERTKGGDCSFLAFNPDGRSILAVDRGRLGLWHATTGEQLAPAAEDAFFVERVQLSADGTLLAAIDQRYGVTLWNSRSGKRVRVLQEQDGAWLHSPFMSLLPRSIVNDMALLWFFCRKVDSDARERLAFTADGKRLAAVVRNIPGDASVSVWDVASGLRHRDFPLKSPTGVAFSPDGRLLAIASHDGKVRLVNLDTGQETRTLLCEGCLSDVAFSPDGKHLAGCWHSDSGRHRSAVLVWDMATGKRTAVLRASKEPIDTVAFSPDGRRVLAAGRAVHVCALEAGKSAELNPAESVAALAFSSDSKALAVLRTGSVQIEPDAHAKRWLALDRHDLATGQSTRTLEKPDTAAGLALSPDGRSLAEAVQRCDGRTGLITGAEIKLWDTVSGKEVRTLAVPVREVPGGLVHSLEFCLNGKCLCLSASHCDVRLWNPDSGRPLAHLAGSDFNTRAVSVSPDGRTLAGRRLRWHSDKPEPIVLWEVASGKERLRIPCTDYVHSLAYRPDGKILAGIVSPWRDTSTTTVRLWDTATGKELQALRGHEASILALAFSPDGKLLATGGRDETLRLWDAVTGKLLCSLDTLGGPVRALAFSLDGKQLAAGASDVLHWNIADLLTK